MTDSRIVDEPYGTPEPIKPNRKMFFMVALLLGIVLPAAAINIGEVLNDKIQSRKEIESTVGVTIFGEIGKKPKEMKDNIIDLKSTSFLAEQFRTLRTNLQYAAGGMTADSGKVLLITSSIGGEGKSFISVNLASSIALLEKKVIVLELDLRKPKISEYLGVTREKGISNYLIGQGNAFEYVKPTTLNPNMFVMPSGPIPPNPSELLANGKISSLIEELKKEFDYIIWILRQLVW
ncbi:polysaccharide biosynthesis tyrosine autokinase [Pseudarcicella hirudinis]|uniref:polysaccharide biosynthesis tyrosine autokinase n=1 Tax=Pseudarcicella hirudinis TaxID=1079859 RepID=UPI0035E9C1B9